MKKFKLVLFSLAFSLLMFTSCTNNEPVDDPQTAATEESESITTSLNQLMTQFDSNGYVSETNNPAGNIVLDFCFDFVFPLTLSYNNGTTVTVQDLDGLIDVMLASSNDLYINGIAFPFDVETFNDDTDTIEIQTINNEAEFIELLLSCGFDEDIDDDCYEDDDPVCVEVTDPSGVTFVVTYPNECYAIEDGFTEDDFIDDCEEDYYSNGPDCFTLNFPLDIIVNDDTVITINSEEELGTAIYDVYDFDFVFPIEVTLENDVVVTIEDEDDFEDLLEDCYDDYDGYEDECDECEDEGFDPVCIEVTTATGITEIAVFPNLCYALCEGFSEDDIVECEDDSYPDDCDECEEEDYDPVCVETNTGSGVTEIVVFPNLCYALCVGFSEDDIVECEDDDYPNDCDEDDLIEFVIECDHYATPIGSNDTYVFDFYGDATLEIESLDGSVTYYGEWIIAEDPTSDDLTILLTSDFDILANNPENGAWKITCGSAAGLMMYSINQSFSIESDCD
ncbi:hypothetical protein [Winogradskyella sp.]|uniref:hypothetical protein n=1 Tax=Winogradskyella sp. TaxID=1883156 RepID=UPI00263A0C10|nr:hypothetical protein [Winogradskyella sp.]